MRHEHNPHYIHHRPETLMTRVIREVVFGMEDGMVSTMGAITGIAAASQNHFFVVLSGCIIIAVESISMAVGSYLSTKSEKEIDERMLFEEKEELREHPREEKIELIDMYKADGFSPELSEKMATEVSQNEKLFLHEMAYRELKIIPGVEEHPVENGVAMGISYVLGGAIPLLPYVFFSNIPSAAPVSIVATLIGLFMLGVYTTTFSKRSWWKAGIEMVLLASAAGIIGYFVGQLVNIHA